MGTPEGWECENHPFHVYPPADPLVCRWCGHRRSAADALVALVAGWKGWSRPLARGLVDAHRKEVIMGGQSIEILRVNGDAENTRNEHGHKTVAVPVEVSGLGTVTLMIASEVASALYRAVCEE
jgi:hypothetical protein